MRYKLLLLSFLIYQVAAAQTLKVEAVSLDEIRQLSEQSLQAGGRVAEANPLLLVRMRDARSLVHFSEKKVLGDGWMAMPLDQFLSQQVWMRTEVEQYGLLDPDSKLSRNFLQEASIADVWQAGGKLRVDLFYFGVPEAELTGALLQRGVEVLPGSSRLEVIRIKANRAQLEQLLQWTNVLYISPVVDSRTPLVSLSMTMNRVNKVQEAVPTGLGLLGDGVKIGVWDFGAVGNHFDYEQGVDNIENEFFNTTGSQHTSLVSGAIVGRGVIRQDIVGMAPKAEVYVHNFFGDIIQEMRDSYTNQGIRVANHSYNLGAAFQCDAFYSYDAASAAIDDFALEKSDLLQVLAAGNSAGPCPFDYENIVPGFQYAKNVVTVGNLQNNETLYPGSAKGPTTDGRLKPDICSKGASTFTPSATGIVLPGINQNYTGGFGTSFSSPQIAAIAGLIQQAADEASNPDPPAVLLKALLCNTAQDLGNPGPDYEYGFGRVDAFKAVKAYQADYYHQDSVSQGQTKTFNISVPAGTGLLKVLLAWHDPATALPAAKILTNDLDLSLSDGLTTWQALKLNPQNPASNAVPGRDSLNNTEQIIIHAPAAGNYSIAVTGFEIPDGQQPYFITWFWDTVGADITFPDGAEVLTANVASAVRWSASQTDSLVDVEYSLDGGSNWVLIGSAEATSGALSWTTPNVFSDSALVRLRAGATTWAISDTFFTIMAKPTIGSILRCNSGLRFNWPVISGATSYVVSRYENGAWMDEDTLAGNIFYKRNAIQGVEYTYSVRPLYGSKSGPRSNASIIVARPANCSFPDNDIGITGIRPLSGRMNTSSSLTSAEPIKVRYQNYRNSASAYNITMHWQVNGGTVFDSTFAHGLAANGSNWFVSGNTFDLSSPGDYTIKVWISSASDLYPVNDTMEVLIRQIANDPYELPFGEQFESDIFSLGDSVLGLPNLDAFDFYPEGNGRVRSGGAQFFAPEGKRAVTLDNFADNSVAATAHLLTTLNLSDYVDSLVYFNFRYRSRGEATGNDEMYVRGSDTATWLSIYDLFAEAPAGSLAKEVERLNLSRFLADNGQQFSSSTQMRASVTTGRAASSINTNGGYTLDDYQLFSPGKDVELLSADFIPTVCSDFSGTDSLEITVSVLNNYVVTLTNIPLYFSSVDTTYEVAQFSIAAFDTLLYTFKHGYQFDSSRVLPFRLWLDFAEDRFPENDSLIDLKLTGLKKLDLPYLNTFESDTLEAWVPSDSNSSWAVGSPGKALMYAPAQGDNAWVTGLDANYNLLEYSQLYIGCIEPSDLSASGQVAFQHILQTEAGFDYISLEYSQDGLVWLPLGEKGNGYNWFNQLTGYPSWQGERAVWQVASYPLSPDSFPLMSPVQLRLILFSDEIISLEGFAVDDWRIMDIANAVTRADDSTYIGFSTGAGEVLLSTNTGKVVARLDDGGQTLGQVTLTVKTQSCIPYLHQSLLWPRNYFIQTANPIAQAVKLTVFMTNDEYLQLTGADSTIRSMREIGALLYNGPSADMDWNNNADSGFVLLLSDSVRFLPYAQGYEVSCMLPFSGTELYFSGHEPSEIFSLQPTSSSACHRQFLVATNISSPTYQWQQKSAGVWVNILPANTDFTGCQSAGLEIVANAAAYDSVAFRCLLSNPQICAVSSDSALYFLAPQVSLAGIGSWSADVSCDHNGWTYYAAASNPGAYLLAVNWAPDNSLSAQNTAAKLAAAVTLNVDPAIYSVSDLSGPEPLATFSMSRYWNVDTDTFALDEPVDLRFYYASAEQLAVAQAAQDFITLHGGNYEGFSWFKTATAGFIPNVNVQAANVLDAEALIDSNITAATENGILYAQFQGIPSFSGGTGATGVGPYTDPLPVELLYFKSTCAGEKALLSWATASEQNAAYFEVQRASDQLIFEAVGRVEAAGNSNVLREYQFEDKVPGNYYYRLKKVDFDGAFEYSDIVSSDCRFQQSSYQILYGTDVFRLQRMAVSDKSVRISLLDASGKSVDAWTEEVPEGLSNMDYPTQRLPKGAYFLLIEESSGQTSLPLVVY
jgi:hypothetical protein